MTISSRTPEGGPNRCPVCGNAIVIEPSESKDGAHRRRGDAPCPRCGTLLWFAVVDSERWFCRYDRLSPSGKERIARVVASLPARLTDSLDAVEAMMALEDEFECSVPDEVVKDLKTIGDFIEFVKRRFENRDD